jgi:hypothetical protein
LTSSDHEFSDPMGIFALYLFNVFEPCSRESVALILRRSDRFSSLSDHRFGARFGGALEALTSKGFIRETTDGNYIVSFGAKELLNLKRLAYPRDRNRLYYLKERLKRRDK